MGVNVGNFPAICGVWFKKLSCVDREPTTSNKESSFINGANSQQLPPSSSSHSSQQNTVEATGDSGSSSKSSNSNHTNHQTTISDDSKNVSSNDGLEGTESPSLLSTCLRNTFLAMDQAFAHKFPKVGSDYSSSQFQSTYLRFQVDELLYLCSQLHETLSSFCTKHFV